jgi:hypothetical protein
MTIGNLQLSFNSFWKRTQGQRETPYVFFYLFPMFTISKTATQEYFSVYLGWLFWNIKITYLRYDNKRRIPK